ncbi:MAG TPA: S9 family peptidase [Caulobacteraceae bacterium]
MTTANAAPPLEAFGRLPAIESAALSPDGGQIAFILTNGEKRSLIVAHTSDLKPIVTADAGMNKVRWVQWAGSGHLVITTSATTSAREIEGRNREWFEAFDFNIATRRTHPLLLEVSGSTNAVLAPPMIRIVGGHPFAFVEGFHFVSDTGYVSLFKVDLDHDLSTLVEQGEAYDDGWLVDTGGEPLAKTAFRPVGEAWALKMKRNGAWKDVKTLQTGIDQPALVGLGRDGESALLYAPGDDASLREMGPQAADWSAPIDGGSDADPIDDPVTGRLIGDYALTGDDASYVFFDPADQARWDKVVKALPGQRVQLESVSADHMEFVVRADAPQQGPAYALVDLRTGSAKWLGLEYEGLVGQLGPVQPVAFKAADGTPLTGYLTLPKGRTAKDLPLVVFPHGGPAARDEPGFDWWAQAMASRGYAVLQVNYRGSDGFGWKFLASGFGEYGRKMQTDLSDGVRWLASQGTIDPKRVCIVGASYGGYAALAGVTLDAGVYRCAVSVAGVSDMKQMAVLNKDFSSIASERYWKRYVGVDQGRSLDDISPIRHLDKLAVPVLLIHGTDDTVVPFEQSRMMADAMTKAGKSVQFVVLKHEDHWLSRGETRLQMLQATMDFLEKNNPPG